MRTSVSAYTSTCDKCGKSQTGESSYPPLHSIYLHDMRGQFASSDCHRHFMDLCEECFNRMLEHLGASDRWAELQQEARRYRSCEL